MEEIKIEEAEVVINNNINESNQEQAQAKISDIDDDEKYYGKRKPSKKSIPVSDKGIKDTEVTMNFMESDFSKEFVGKTTVDSKTDSFEKEEPKKDVEEVRNQIRKEEVQYGHQFTYEDFENFATIAIEILDAVISSGCKWWAKDTSDTAYSLTEKKKKMLIKQLTLVLVKYQLKWNILFLFFVSLVTLYFFPIKKANENRKLATTGIPVDEKVPENIAKEFRFEEIEEERDGKKVKTGFKRAVGRTQTPPSK